jgi:3-deoxy-D-manno-octulosonic-acid transferase
VISIYRTEYRSRLMERFGLLAKLQSKSKRIWIHAVSVGEVYTSKPLVEFIQHTYPHYQIIITTVTPTGADTVRKIFAESVLHRYLPFDVPICVNKFLQAINPQLLIVFETEIWPVLYTECGNNKIPIALVNARLSDKSYSGYRLLSSLTCQTLSHVTVIAAQSKTDANKFISLGVNQDKVFDTGNLKFDVTMPDNAHETGRSIKRNFENRPIIVAASTHAGEEEILLDALIQIKLLISDCLLIIAPRHPNRTLQICKLCNAASLSVIRYSDNKRKMDNCDVFILDTLGQLPGYYAAADIAFVGGSLVPIGGHNMLEPAAYGLAIISGEYLSNFQDVAELLYRDKALIKITNAKQLSATIKNLFENTELRQGMGVRAKAVLEKNKGTIHKIVKLINGMMP